MKSAGDPYVTFILSFFVDAARIFAGAAITVFFVNRIKSKDDHLERRIDEMCTEIRQIAELSSKYWSQPDSNECKILGVQIKSRIRAVEEILTGIGRLYPGINDKEVTVVRRDFFREATGGDFGVNLRLSDFVRARNVHDVAVRFIVAIRRVRLNSHRGIFRSF